jgi:Zn-dependent M28 family amino/carboxypeptidase
VLFVRSDQYSFVKQGVPSVFPVVGFKSNDATIDPVKIWDRWEAERYHQPQDDIQQPGLLYNEAITFARFNFLLGYFVAQGPQRPEWNKGDFFGGLYGKRANGS